jgi:hypothetical protein
MGSSGGGGSSGKVDYPDYMKNWHRPAICSSWDIDGVPTELLSVSLTGAMNEALDGPSPYAGFVGIDAEDVMLGSGKVITDFTAPYDILATYSALVLVDLITLYRATNPVSALATSVDAMIDAIVVAEGALLDSDINQNTLPQFQAGLRDVNAVMASAFVVGEGIIWAQKAKALAKADAVLRFDGYKTQIDLTLHAEELTLRQAVAHAEVQRTITALAGDYAKLYTTMRVDLDNNNLEILAKDALWDVKVFQYGGNFLGSIAGSAVSTDAGNQSSKAAAIASTVIGGAAAIASIYSSLASAGGAAAGAGGTATPIIAGLTMAA